MASDRGVIFLDGKTLKSSGTAENIFASLNWFTTLAPKSHPAPLGDMDHESTSSGSDQTRSQKAPLLGIS
ncbi:hypothetical protein BpHYR1_007071 [Brachionus plicatilis]|uniref:Uncharacterized protein n=1 Tax=Brachionus plicatilis TaxID=10195 RepID=A0A3M7PL86_BRAPC|nr:hypothetical protein BpHYR1_007071 [Brachionus plicatilis]